MSNDRDQAGRFPAGRSGNPKGRPKKGRGVDAAITRAAQELITVTQKGRPKRVTKLEVNAAQMVNQGASGDPRLIKMTLDYTRKAEENAQAEAARAPVMTKSDREIADLFVAHLTKMIREQELEDEAGADPDA